MPCHYMNVYIAYDDISTSTFTSISHYLNVNIMYVTDVMLHEMGTTSKSVHVVERPPS